MNKEFISAKRFTKKIIIEFILWSIIISYLISFVLVSVDIITNHFLTYNDEINLLNILNPFLHFILGKSLAIIITIKTLIKNYQIFPKDSNQFTKNILIFLIIVLGLNTIYTLIFYKGYILLLNFIIVNVWITYLLYIYIKKKIRNTLGFSMSDNKKN